MSEVSRQYHNLKYAIETLSEVIKSCKIEKVVEEKYKPQLERLTVDFKRVKKMLEDEKNNAGKRGGRWGKKVRQLSVDAILDESISDDLRERIIEGVNELEQKISSHKDP